MFTPEQFIDSVQNAKKQIVNTFVVNAEIKKGLNEVIDAQTAFSKTVAQNALLFSQIFVKNFAVGSAK
jgi:hypothetical protein